MMNLVLIKMKIYIKADHLNKYSIIKQINIRRNVIFKRFNKNLTK